MKGKALLISKESNGKNSLAEALVSDGISTIVASSAAEGADTLQCDPSIDVVLVEQAKGDPDSLGVMLLERIRGSSSLAQVIILSDASSAKEVNAALRMGAFEYILEPVSRERALYSVNLAVKMAHLIRENAALKSRLYGRVSFATIITENKETLETREKARLLASLDTPVLICGEPGTGRRLLAEAIHNESPRGERPFVYARITGEADEAALERRIFGAERGADKADGAPEPGYMEKASGGTLYICDIGRLSHRLQGALLGVAQRGEFFRVGGYEPVKVDFRLMAGSGPDLEDDVASGGFRPDLYYRLNASPLSLPPLRKRKEDVPVLAMALLGRYRDNFGGGDISIAPEAMSALTRYRWPGNIQELSDVIEKMAMRKKTGELGIGDLPDRIYKDARRPGRTPRQDRNVLSYTAEKLEFERKYLARALQGSEGNITVMARITGLSRPALYEKLRKHGLK